MTAALQSALGFFAHPDDETILAGGMIAMLIERGIPVHIVSATRGEGGELGEPPIVPDQALLGTVREAELRCAAEKLGATVTFLDYVDPPIGPDDELRPFQADFETLVNQFAAVVRERRADLIFTHGADGEYGHPAHILAHQAVLACARTSCANVLVYAVAANVPSLDDHILNQSQPAHFAQNITPWAEKKIDAMECHHSQHALFKRRRKLQTVAEALRRVESVRCVWPGNVGDQLPDDAFAALLRDVGAWTPQEV